MEIKKVIFDTNAYRGIVRNKSFKEFSSKIVEIINLQRKKSIQSVQSTIVMSELLKHLKDRDDDNYLECKNALVALVIHCKNFGKASYTYEYSPTLLNAMHIELTGKEYNNKAYEHSVGHLAHQIHVHFSDEFIHSKKTELELNYREHFELKKTFFNSLIESLTLIDTSSTDLESFLKNKNHRRKIISQVRSPKFDELCIRTLIDITIKSLGITSNVSSEDIERIKIKYSPVIELYRFFWLKIINGILIGDEFHKEFNTFYDMMIIFGSLCSDSNSILVSNEKQLKRCFENTNLDNRIMTLEEYMDFLKE